MYRRQAFTLIELLVVTSIIALLIAILLPVLGAARDTAVKTQCAVNLKQLSGATAAYAADNKGDAVPTYTPSGVVHGAFAIWRSDPAAWQENDTELSDIFGGYRRVGILMSMGYSDSPEILYCPAMAKTHAWLAPGKIDPNNAARGSWIDESVRPVTQRLMNWSYHYRDTYLGEDYNEVGTTFFDSKLTNVLNLDRDSPDMVMFADAFSDYDDRGVIDAHGDGYNTGRIDGSVTYYLDLSEEIRNLNGGADYHLKRRILEQAWESFRWGGLVTDQASLTKP